MQEERHANLWRNENDETVLWSSGTHARVVDGDRLRDLSEGGNERLARVTFGGNSIVESCKVIERCGGLPGLVSPSLPSNLPSSLSSSLLHVIPPHFPPY